MGQREWMSIMVRAARRFDAAPFAFAVIDPSTREVAFHNAATGKLLGRSTAPTLPALERLGLVPASVWARLAADWSSAADECVRVEARVGRTDGPDVEVEVHLTRLGAFRGGGSVITVVATDFDNTFDNADLEATNDPPPALYFGYDADMVTVASDERLSEYGMDPSGQIGGNGILELHPADAPRVAPLARAVTSGERPSAEYAIRVPGPGGAWTNVTCRLRGMEGADVVAIATIRPADHRLPAVDLSLLSEREKDVARALFAGHRPTQIAAADQVSVRTVRNQMASLFRKLGVAGQVELTSRYQLPDPDPPSAHPT